MSKTVRNETPKISRVSGVENGRGPRGSGSSGPGVGFPRYNPYPEIINTRCLHFTEISFEVLTQQHCEEETIISQLM